MTAPLCDTAFTSNRTYPRALERARYLGFESVYEAISTKIRAGEPVQSVADKLDVSWETADRWMKAAGILPNKNPRKRTWWVMTEIFPRVGRLKK